MRIKTVVGEGGNTVDNEHDNFLEFLEFISLIIYVSLFFSYFLIFLLQ